MNSTRTTPLAIVGMSALYPGSQDGTGFWRDILGGRDLVGPVPPQYWLLSDYHDPDPQAPDKTYATRGAFLDPVSFDPLAFGIPPSMMESTDTGQLLALIVAQRVLEDATRGDLSHLDREKVSVILGVTSAQELLGDMVSRLQRPVWVKALRESGLPEAEVQAACDRISSHYVPWTEATFPGLLGNVVAGRIANRLDLHGTNCVTDAACASTFSALSMAAHELWAGSSDMVITGGVDTMNGIFMHMCFSKTPALSPTGECRPFDADGDGTLLGEGMAMFALRRLDDAVRDGDRIHAVIRAVGSSSDGRAKSVYAPVSEGQARAIRRAYDRAGYGPETVELVEAHGTGTRAGDAAELKGLRLAFDDAPRTDRPWVAVGSVKSQIGHTKAAAGAAGLFKAVMALKHRTLPPSIKVRSLNPAATGEGTSLYVNTEARPWVRDDAHPRRAGVSSFGFGGSNFHIAVEAYTGPGAAPRTRTLAAELLPLAAADAASLADAAERLAAQLDDAGALAWQAWRLAQAPAAGSHRLAVVAGSEAAAQAALRDAAQRIRRAPDAPFTLPNGAAYGFGAAPGEVAFLFPGQGSQYVGMSGGLAMAFDAAMDVWDRAATLGVGAGGRALHRVVFPVPALDDAGREAQASALTATEQAQPALGAASAATLALLAAAGVRASAVAGHSFGEVAALHAAGALTLDELLTVAAARGASMAAAASTPGAMCAVRADVDAVRSRVASAGVDVVVANHNHPEQVVLSGAVDAIDAAIRVFEGAGISARRLDVATAFHSPIVAGAASSFAAALEGVRFQKPAVPVIADATARPYPAKATAIRAQLAEQLVSPVRFVEVVEALYAQGCRVFVEVGPQAVLTGLTDRILGDRPHRAVATDRRGKDGVVQLLLALGELFAVGVPVEAAALWAGYEAPGDPGARPKPKMAVPIAGWNVGRPYPPPGGEAALPAPNPPRAPQEPIVVEKIVEKVVHVPAAQSAAPAQPVAAAPAAADVAWVSAFQEIQRQTAEAHASYQDAMARSHEAFLATVQQAIAGLTGTVSPALTMAAVAPAPRPAPPVLPPPVVAPAPVHVAAPVVAPPPVVAPVAAPVAPPAVRAAPPAPAPAPAPTLRAPQAGGDLSGLLLDVVAEKTGYPAEMLTLEMDLEADLGVDSIKRVEILSAVRERAPGLPEVDAGEMAKLRTLGQIVAQLGGVSAAPPAPSAAPPSAHAAAAPSGDLSGLLLDVVAEKTGYPAEMLTLEMDLEADLGVDSIKRVEILSAVRERAPGLPEVDAGEMAKLRTLGQIVDQLGGAGGAALPPTPSPLQGGHAALGRFVVEAVEAPASGLGLGGMLTGEVQVVGDPSGIGAALVAELSAQGASARLVAAPEGAPQALIWLGGIELPADRAGRAAVSKAAFRALKAVAPAFVERGGAFVTVQDTGGALGFGAGAGDRAWAGGLPGLVKTFVLESPKVRGKAIDVAVAGRDARTVARALLDELVAGGPEVEVGLGADGRRVTPRVARVAAGGGALRLGPTDVVVASGGARGVTAATMIALARASKARFVLLGRTPLADEPAGLAGAHTDAELKKALLAAAAARGEKLAPAALGKQVAGLLAGREVRATIAAIEAAGGKARYVAADVQDATALGHALDAVRASWGPITALVHGAGVLADRYVVDKTPEQFDQVFDTKVEGLGALLQATSADPLAAILLFSSVAARSGNTGQCDYAMANETLNKVALAEAARRPGCVVRALGWGPWKGGMVNPALEARFAQLGVAMIPLDVGAAMLVDELRAGTEGTELVLGAEPKGALLAEDATPAMEAWVRVDMTRWPWLADHRVRGAVVVPVVGAAEWMLRAARAVRPDLLPVEVRQVEVLRGLRLPDVDTKPVDLAVRARQLENGDGALLLVEIADPAGRPAYRAQVRLAASAVQGPKAGAAPALPAWGGVVYDGDVLFHGPRFQALSGVALGEDQATAEVQGMAPLSWATEGFQSDPAALDALLQLGVRWAAERLGGATLPLSVGAIVLHAPGALDAPLRAVVRGRTAGRDQARFDAALVGADGRLRAELREVAVTRVPQAADARPTA